VRGAFEIVDGRGRTIAADALGTWRFAWAGSGVVKLAPPRGYRLPLQVGVVNAPDQVEGGKRVRLTVALSRAAIVRVSTEGEPEDEATERVIDGGRRSVTWLAPAEPGRYSVLVEASAGNAGRHSDAVDIVVVDQEEPPERAAEDDPGGGSIRLIVVLIGGLIGLAGVTLARRMGS
jgi:hypothetical protein